MPMTPAGHTRMERRKSDRRKDNTELKALLNEALGCIEVLDQFVPFDYDDVVAALEVRGKIREFLKTL